MIKVASMNKEVLSKAYCSGGFVKWTVVIVNDIAGIPFRAEIEIADEENPFVRWYEPDQPEYSLDGEENDGDIVWVLKRDGKEVVVISEQTWMAVHVNDVKTLALKAVDAVEAAEQKAVKDFIEGQVGA